MIIFGEFKLVLQISGLDPEGGRRNLIARIIFSILFVLFNLTATVFLIRSFVRDIEQILLIMPVYLAYHATIVIYIHLLMNRKEFYSLLDELQDILEESE